MVVRKYPVYYCNVDGLKRCSYDLSYYDFVEYKDRIYYSGLNIEYINGVFILWRFKNG